jgi:hypothetical protein
MPLEGSTGRVLGREEVDGRPAIVAEFTGLRNGEDTVFRFHVDVESGVALKMSREDMGVVLRVEALRVAKVEDPFGA